MSVNRGPAGVKSWAHHDIIASDSRIGIDGAELSEKFASGVRVLQWALSEYGQRYRSRRAGHERLYCNTERPCEWLTKSLQRDVHDDHYYLTRPHWQCQCYSSGSSVGKTRVLVILAQHRIGLYYLKHKSYLVKV
jgi:hypothetical protein